MRVNSYTQASDGSDYYRLKLPAQALKAQGLDIEYMNTGEEGRDADVLVFNRPASRKAVEVIAKLVSEGYAVVVDVDDLFSHVRQGHALYGDRADLAHGWVKWACREATMVTGTTQGVIDEYGFGHGRVIPNYIPEWYLTVEKKQEARKLRVGWSGTVNSHPNDLQVTGGGIAKALVSANADFAYVGPKEQAPEVKKALSLKHILTSGWFSLEDYPKAMAQLDVGIVPLEDCMFNDAKSWLKGLEFAALGVPFVASPTREYDKLMRFGAGVLAHWSNDWRYSVGTLLRNSYLRTQCQDHGREVAAELTIEKHTDEWVSVFEEAAMLRRPSGVVS